jgi:lipopolysaccharide/colanic/teichoic acid biosynthesis glycosyltransferase
VELIESQTAAEKKRRQRNPFESHADDVASMGNAAPVPRSPLESTSSRTAKRTVDVALSVTLGVLALPLIVVTAAAIKCVSRGPVFYGQLRLGQNGKPFRMWKFRTMVDDAEHRIDEYLLDNPDLLQEWNVNFKLKNDPRAIPWIGKVLRVSGLDELPQLWNVLSAEMSFVGPRPLPQYHLDQFEEEFRLLREVMPPGITGQWQVYGRNHGDPDMFRKWDAYYVHNWSLWLDLQILSRTPWIMFFRT